jgi:drug/metabolite transporter (DMT)-like permease
VPTYLVCAGPAHLAALPLGVLAMQGVVQGGIQAVFGMMAFSQAVVLLGVSRAVLFPTIVPALSILIGIPIVGEIPSILQITGLVLVTVGLLASIGVFNRLFGWRRA